MLSDAHLTLLDTIEAKLLSLAEARLLEEITEDVIFSLNDFIRLRGAEKEQAPTASNL